MEGADPERIVMLIILAGRIGLVVDPGDEVRNAQRPDAYSHVAGAGRGTRCQGDVVVERTAGALVLGDVLGGTVYPAGERPSVRHRSRSLHRGHAGARGGPGIIHRPSGILVARDDVCDVAGLEVSGRPDGIGVAERPSRPLQVSPVVFRLVAGAEVDVPAARRACR